MSIAELNTERSRKMTNYEELEKTVEAMQKMDEVPWELQQTIYLGAIAQFLAKIADALEQNRKEQK